MVFIFVILFLLSLVRQRRTAQAHARSTDFHGYFCETGTPVEGPPQERWLKLKLPRVESQLFSMTLLFDLGVGVMLFAVTFLCFFYRLPLLGDPLALLSGPFIGLVLSLKHRPPR
jgi:hypothetical protein